MSKIHKHYDINFKLCVIRNYYSNKYKIKELLDIFQISNGTLYNWINKFKTNQLDNRKQKPEKLSGNMKCWIKAYILRKVNFDYKKVLSLITKKYKINISKSLLYTCIHDLNLTKKKINKRFIYTKEHIRKQQLINFKNKISQYDFTKIISIDETSIDTHISYNYGWCCKGNKLIKINKNLRIRYTVISAISNNKVILNKIIKGSSNAIIFLEFIKELLQLVDNDSQLLLDNARIHHSKILKQYLGANIKNLIYNVPYSPEFNPIEKVFSQVKNHLKKAPYTNKTIYRYIIKAFNSIKSENLEKFYKKSLNF
jgi:transposase